MLKKLFKKNSKKKRKSKNNKRKFDDKRSYHINSDKIKDILNFTPENSIESAIKDLCVAFKKNLIKESLLLTIYTSMLTGLKILELNSFMKKSNSNWWGWFYRQSYG